jgi:hypothetical protein
MVNDVSHKGYPAVVIAASGLCAAGFDAPLLQPGAILTNVAVLARSLILEGRMILVTSVEVHRGTLRRSA